MDRSAYVEMMQTEDRHWWFKARREIIESIIGTLNLKPDARILEVGAGTGGNLRMLSRHGLVSAIEMDDQAIAFAQAKTRGAIVVEKGICPDRIPFSGETFDLVCMFDVLEHIEGDRETLRALRTRLSPAGTLLITVPAYQWLWSRHDVHLHHFRRYSAPRLRRLLEASGYRVARMTYFNTLLLPMVALARVADRLLHRSTASGAVVPSAPVNEVLYRIFGAERTWLRRWNLPLGVSLLAAAKPAR